MLYPVYVHPGNDTHAHGVTIPDFPGCFTAADAWEDLPRMIQEAAEVYFEGEDMEVPAPTPMDRLAQDSSYAGGAWMLVDIDLTKISTRVRRVNITLPENLLKTIDRFAGTHHMSRSAFLARAAGKYISDNHS
jgi:predicted RNase H-like HicB family nuclease